MQHGEEVTREAIYAAIRPPAQSPFDTMSEAEFTAVSASDKAWRVHEHYGEALAVDANGQLLSRYEAGDMESHSAVQFRTRCSRAFPAPARPVLVGENHLSGGDAEADYSSAGRTGTPSDWFSQRGTRYPERPVQPAQQIALASHPV